jgi:predicted transcriptional regulator
MSKSLYSVVLTDEVVREIDRLALRESTNRSNLINQILAEYVSYVTPEMRINSIFRTIEEIIDSRSMPMVTAFQPHQSTMSLKSNLEYRYRPTVKYDVELFKSEENGAIGRLSVVFRTQSQALLDKMNDFFRLWSVIESGILNKSTGYTLSQGRFTRTITLSKSRSYTVEEIADAISIYIKTFDQCMKAFLNGELTEEGLIKVIKSYTVKEVII